MGNLNPGGGGGGGGLLGPKIAGGVPRATEKLEPKRSREKMVFWGQKDRILRGFVPKRSFLCWWMRKNTPKRSSLVPRGSKKGVKTAAHMYHHHIGSTPPPPPPPPPRDLNPQQCRALLSSVLPNHPSTHPRWVKSCFGRVQNSGITYQIVCVVDLLSESPQKESISWLLRLRKAMKKINVFFRISQDKNPQFPW